MGPVDPPIWPCSARGLPCPGRRRPGGGLLPHLFTLTPPEAGRCVFCGTFPRVAAAGRYPACSHPEFGLSSLPPCACRTGSRAPAASSAGPILNPSPVPASSRWSDAGRSRGKAVPRIGQVPHLLTRIGDRSVLTARRPRRRGHLPPERTSRDHFGPCAPRGIRQGAVVGGHPPSPARRAQKRDDRIVGAPRVSDLDRAECLGFAPAGWRCAVEEDDDADALTPCDREGGPAHRRPVTPPRQVVAIQEPRHGGTLPPSQNLLALQAGER